MYLVAAAPLSKNNGFALVVRIIASRSTFVESVVANHPRRIGTVLPAIEKTTKHDLSSVLDVEHRAKESLCDEYNKEYVYYFFNALIWMY